MMYSVYAESTPNPETMKFVTNRMLFRENIEINSPKESQGISIAEALFKFPFIKSIYLSSNFISITKIENIKWEDIAMQTRLFIVNFLNEEKFSNHNADLSANDKHSKVKKFSKKEEEINAILDKYIKPAVESDGGSIILDSFHDGVVTVVLKGACNGCPSSTITLKQGIETLLKQKIGEEIKEVCAK